MTLMIRLTRLLSADLHALMDRLEEPGALLAQAQREMEEALAGDRAGLATLERRREQLEREQALLGDRLRACAAELDLCLAEDNDALAREVLRRRLLAEAQQLELDREHSDLARETQALRGRIERQAQAVADVAAEAERLHGRAHSNDRTATTGERVGPVSDEAIELALLAARRARRATS